MDRIGSITSLIEAIRDKIFQNYLRADVSAEIEGLVEIVAGDEVAILALIDCLKTDPGGLVQNAIAEALVDTENEFAVAHLMAIVFDRQAQWELRSRLITKLGSSFSRQMIDRDMFTSDMVEIMNDKQEDLTVRRSALKTLEESCGQSILTAIAICALLADKDMYGAAGKVIEAAKRSAVNRSEEGVVSFLNGQMEALHKKGVAVRIPQFEQIDRPVLAAIREASWYWSSEDKYKIFPCMRLGMVKGKCLTLEKLTQEFGLRYYSKFFSEVDCAEAGETISRYLGHHVVDGTELMPQDRAIALAKEFLDCLNADNGDRTRVRYYTGSSATFHFRDVGIIGIGEETAGCIWVSGND
jgi:hypothetical protein